MTNFPGPYELRFRYITTASAVVRTHEHRMSVHIVNDLTPGLAFSDYDVALRNTTNLDLQVMTDAYFDLLQELFNTTTDFPAVELWRYPTASFDAQFWAVYALGGVGASASASQLDGQALISFRSANGGIAFLEMMESIAVPGITQFFPTASAPVNALAAYAAGVATPFKARDNGYLIAPLHYLPGINERLTRDRLRP